MAQTDIRASALSELLPVRNVIDLALLVKESELMTGKPGRQFIVAGGDRPTYEVRLGYIGFEIHRLDHEGGASSPVQAYERSFFEHPVGNAMTHGRLFTQELQLH